jgi:hypothetical protein
MGKDMKGSDKFLFGGNVVIFAEAIEEPYKKPLRL